MDKMIYHRINRSRRHQYADDRKPLYHVRWRGFEAGDHTWEPTRHLPRRKVLSYNKRKKLPIAETIDQTDVG